MRVGFTVTKKIGGAVVRNRMKRRFRALARELLPGMGIRGADHVLIGRSGAVERDFTLLRDELRRALRKMSEITVRPEPVEGLPSSLGRPKKDRASTSSARTGGDDQSDLGQTK
jgi:ribonuclease P protein component